MPPKRKGRKRSATPRKTNKTKRLCVAGPSNTSEVNEDSGTAECSLGALLEDKDAKLVTLVADKTEVVVHRSVLVAKSTKFATLLPNNMEEDRRIIISDVEPNVLQQLVLFMYQGRTPQPPRMAAQLLVAADKYGVLNLKEKCELQLALNLSVKKLVMSTLFARRHSCQRLGKTATCLFQANPVEVMNTEGWKIAVRRSPEEFVEVSHLLAWTPAKNRYSCQEEMDRKLFEAVENGRVEEVREMLATGSSVGARDSASGRTALHYASDLETVKCLLVAGALVNARTRAGRTPLHTAVLRRSVSTVERLIKASAHVNATDMHGNTPLHLAAQLGCDAVKTLLERCKHRNAVNVFGETPLKVARRCNQKCASKMLSVSDSAKLPESAENREKLVCDLKSLLNVPDATLITLVAGKTRLAVHRSVLTARSPVFAAMLAHDTVEASSGQIIIPDIEPNVLHQLVEYMYREYVPEFCTEAQELLVAADKYCMPDLKARCELQLIQDLSVENVTVNCLLAVRHSCLQLKKAAGCFLQANLTRVMDTVGWAEAVTDNPEEFLEVCCLLASLPAETRTPSQKALDGKLLRAIRASTDCVARLISLGACVGARGTGGRTALHIAASCKANGNQSGGTHLPDHPGCCNDCKVKLKTLLEAGADVGARDVNGRTALHLAAASGCEDVTECLLQAGASANVTDRWLQMPLHASLQNGSVGAALDMLRAPVDVNVGDLYGNTPLHVAAQLGNETVFSALLKAGADKNARNSLGETPLDLAERYNMNHLVEVIKVNLTS